MAEQLLKKGAGKLRYITGTLAGARIADMNARQVFVLELSPAMLIDTLGNERQVEQFTLYQNVYVSSGISPGFLTLRDSICAHCKVDDISDAIGKSVRFERSYVAGDTPGVEFRNDVCVGAKVEENKVALTKEQVEESIVGKTPSEVVRLRADPAYKDFRDALVSRTALTTVFPNLGLDESSNTYRRV